MTPLVLFALFLALGAVVGWLAGRIIRAINDVVLG